MLTFVEVEPYTPRPKHTAETSKETLRRERLEGSVRVPFILAGPGVRPRRIHQAADFFCL